MQAVAPVQRQGCGADQFGQFPGRVAPHQVHLEIALLRVGVAQGARQIAAVGGLESERAQCVALQRDGCGEAGQGGLAVDARQAAAQGQPAGTGGEGEKQEQGEQGAAQPAHRAFLRDKR